MPATSTSDAEVFLRPGQAAKLLHVDAKTVSRWAKEGKLPYFKTLGGHYLFPEPAILALRDHLAAGS